MKTIWYYIRQIFQSLNNLIVWFPIIWNDRQWDDDYILFILRKKFIMMESFYRSPKAHHLYALKDAENIHVAISVLDRMISHNYLDESLQEFYEAGYTLKDIPLEKLGQDEEAINLFRKCGKRADQMEEEDFDFLFEHLREHIRDWWD